MEPYPPMGREIVNSPSPSPAPQLILDFPQEKKSRKSKKVVVRSSKKRSSASVSMDADTTLYLIHENSGKKMSRSKRFKEVRSPSPPCIPIKRKSHQYSRRYEGRRRSSIPGTIPNEEIFLPIPDHTPSVSPILPYFADRLYLRNGPPLSTPFSPLVDNVVLPLPPLMLPESHSGGGSPYELLHSPSPAIYPPLPLQSSSTVECKPSLPVPSSPLPPMPMTMKSSSFRDMDEDVYISTEMKSNINNRTIYDSLPWTGQSTINNSTQGGGSMVMDPLYMSQHMEPNSLSVPTMNPLPPNLFPKEPVEGKPIDGLPSADMNAHVLFGNDVILPVIPTGKESGLNQMALVSSSASTMVPMSSATQEGLLPTLTPQGCPEPKGFPTTGILPPMSSSQGYHNSSDTYTTKSSSNENPSVHCPIKSPALKVISPQETGPLSYPVVPMPVSSSSSIYDLSLHTTTTSPNNSNHPLPVGVSEPMKMEVIPFPVLHSNDVEIRVESESQEKQNKEIKWNQIERDEDVVMEDVVAIEEEKKVLSQPVVEEEEKKVTSQPVVEEEKKEEILSQPVTVVEEEEKVFSQPAVEEEEKKEEILSQPVVVVEEQQEDKIMNAPPSTTVEEKKEEISSFSIISETNKESTQPSSITNDPKPEEVAINEINDEIKQSQLLLMEDDKKTSSGEENQNNSLTSQDYDFVNQYMKETELDPSYVDLSSSDSSFNDSSEYIPPGGRSKKQSEKKKKSNRKRKKHAQQPIKKTPSNFVDFLFQENEQRGPLNYDDIEDVFTIDSTTSKYHSMSLDDYFD